MNYYIIEDDRGHIYKDILFTTQSAASEVVDALEQEYGRSYWITSLIPHQNIGLMEIIDNIKIEE